MRPLIRGLIMLGLAWLAFVLYSRVHVLQKAENPDNYQIMLLFIGIIAVAIALGIMVAVTVVPAIGEAIGSFFFSPNVEVEKDPHSAALAKIAMGDYEGAIKEYKRIIGESPEDTHAISEVVRIYCDKLENHDAAEAFLTESLQKEWPADQGAFLATRLVDIYWNHKHDADSARHILNQIVENMPETKHAANATHRLHEIERELGEEQVDIQLHSKPALPSAPADEPEPES